MGKCLFMRKGSVHTVPGSRLPDGYTELVYIQNSGTQLIDTEYVPSGETTVEITFRCEKIAGGEAENYPVYGSANGYNQNAFELWSLSKGFCTYGSQDYKSNFGLTAGVKYTSIQSKNVLTINGNTFTFTKQTFSTPYNLLLFATHRDNGIIISADDAKLKIYSCKIYANDTLIRDYVPCITASGEVGLYDLVGKQVYGNAGTGVFIGSEVE